MGHDERQACPSALGAADKAWSCMKLTDERATIAVSVRGVADTGQYALFVGSAAVKGVRPSESNMRWLYVVLIGCAAVIVVLIVLPEVSVSFRRGVQRGRGRRK